jgi:hypothetical protein
MDIYMGSLFPNISLEIKLAYIFLLSYLGNLRIPQYIPDILIFVTAI